MPKEQFHSRVYTDRPAYADFAAPEKFEAIKSIVAKRLVEHPNAICSYSGGSDSDIMLHLIEEVRHTFELPPIKYCFFNTGLEMAATKRHVRETAEKYGVEITEYRPKKNIVLATREYGQPFMSKIMSRGLGDIQKKNIPLNIANEYAKAEDKIAKRKELRQRYPKCDYVINFVCGCDSNGIEYPNSQNRINGAPFLLDFIDANPPQFKISNKCCDVCKKAVAHNVNKGYDMVITGERATEGGQRAVIRQGCFAQTANGQYRMRPLFYVSDRDKAWYKDYHGIRYSDAYEVYGLKRTGCCGCAISAKATEELEKIRPYEPNLVKAAWNVFGDSYRYRAMYNEYKAKRRAAEEKQKK